jgi:FMN phosphatase YigB (HAD superfamily)
MEEKVLVFDLDGTLYDASNGYVEHIRSNIFDFMRQKVMALPRSCLI